MKHPTGCQGLLLRGRLLVWSGPVRLAGDLPLAMACIHTAERKEELVPASGWRCSAGPCEQGAPRGAVCLVRVQGYCLHPSSLLPSVRGTLLDVWEAARYFHVRNHAG